MIEKILTHLKVKWHGAGGLPVAALPGNAPGGLLRVVGPLESAPLDWLLNGLGSVALGLWVQREHENHPNLLI